MKEHKFKKDDIIYPYKIDKNIKEVYESLFEKEKEGYVASVMQYYCPDCKQFAGPYYETFMQIDELGTCPVCGRKIEVPLLDFIVLYKVLKDFSWNDETDRKTITEILSNTLIKEKFTGHGKYWAKEVSIDYGSVNVKRVDFMEFVPQNQCFISALEKGIFVCYEVKSCIEDVYSGNGLNFIGEKNYIVTTMQCYKELEKDMKSGKFWEYLKENHPESSNHVGVLVLIPNGSSKEIEYESPSMIVKEKGFSLECMKKCKEGYRKRPLAELLFCMLRAKGF